MQRRVLLFLGVGIAAAVIASFFLLSDSGNFFAGVIKPNQQTRSNPESGRSAQMETPGTLRESNQPAVPGRPFFSRSSPNNCLALFETWLSSGLNNNGVPDGSIAQTLIRLLHSDPKGNEAFYRRALQALKDPSIPSELKRQLIFVMQRGGTPQSLDTLLALSRQGLPESLKQTLYSALDGVGDYYWDKKSFAELSPLLLQAWGEAQDPRLLSALASALAKVGDAEGVARLLDAVLSQGATLAEIQTSTDPRISAALSSLDKVQNPDLIPVIARHLSYRIDEAAELAVCAGMLATMGQVDATRALLEWAQGAGDEFAPLIRDAFAKLRGAASYEYLSSAAAQNASFKSNLVKQAVFAAVKTP